MMVFCDSYFERVYQKDLCDISQRVPSCSGTPTEPIYEPVADENGIIDLKMSKKVKNVYDEIQSHKDSVDLNLLLKRIENNDLSAMQRLNQNQGFYADLKDCPSDFQSVLNLWLRAKDEFNTLPSDVREQFANDPNVFVTQMSKDPGVLDEVVAKVYSKSAAPVVSDSAPVKDGESNV